jgi:prepilin-type processing-associated H-X9-DG protein
MQRPRISLLGAALMPVIAILGSFRRRSTTLRSGATLIELLVVLFILLLLVQLALPAVQRARESARATQCRSHLQQLARGALLHEATHGRFPSAGWRDPWMADPDRGSDAAQPGGWTYNILPFIEQQQLHELGRGLRGQPRSAALAQLMTTPLATFICPSRRSAELYPGFAGETRNYSLPDRVAKTDYAANSGDFFTGLWPSAAINESLQPPEPDAWIPIENYTGVIYHRSEVRPADIRDGLSQTYLVGEKLLDARQYETGKDGGDDQVLYVGADYDGCRWTQILPSDAQPFGPRADADYGGHPAQFGSAHPAGCHMAFCDGSVQTVAFDVDPDVHRWRGNRLDAEGRFHYRKRPDGSGYDFTPLD